MPLKSRINGNEYNIANQDEINFDFIVSGDSPNVTFNQEFTLEFVEELRNNPIDAINNAMANVGVLKDIPCDIFDLLGNNFKGRLLSGASSSEYSYNPTTYKMLWRPETNKFFEKAQNLPLRDFLTESNFRKVRYIRENVPNAIETVLIAFAAYQLTTTTIMQAFRLSESINDAIAIASAGLTGQVGAFIKAVGDAILQAALLALLLLALNELIKQISESLFQKPKAYYYLNVLEVIQLGCANLGYNFESTTLETTYKDLSFLHATSAEGELRSRPTNDPIPNISLLDFIDKFARLFNGKLKEDGTKITLLPKESYLNEPPLDIQLQDNYNKGTFKFNTDELNKKISLSYLNAPSDGQFSESKYEVSYESKIVPNKDIGITNALDVKFPFLIANWKIGQTQLETFFNSIFDIITGLSSRYKIRGGNRRDYMLLSADIVPNDVIFIERSGEKVSGNTRDLLNAKLIFDNHYENEAPYNNQYYIYTNRTEQPQLTLENNFKLAENFNIKDSDGETIHVTKSAYDHMRRISELEYRKKIKASQFGYFSKDDFNIKTS